MNSHFRISDGTTHIDMTTDPGVMPQIWRPQIVDFKSGGVWMDSPMASGRQLVHGVYANTVESITVAVNAVDQNTLIRRMQDLRRLLKKAEDYWLTSWQNEPVWIEARASCEDNTRYALIHRGRVSEDGEPFAQPFTSKKPVMENLILSIERSHWMDHMPGTGECVEVGNEVDESLTAVAAESTSLQEWAEGSGIPYSDKRGIQASNGYFYVSCFHGDIYCDTTGVGDAFANVGTAGPGGGVNYVNALIEADDGSLLAAFVNTAATAAIYRSTDFGVTWVSVLSIALASRIKAPSILKAQTGDLFALFNDPSGAGLVLYRSTDNGATWGFYKGIVDGELSNQYTSPSITMSNGNMCFLAGTGILLVSIISSDDGETWERHQTLGPMMDPNGSYPIGGYPVGGLTEHVSGTISTFTYGISGISYLTLSTDNGRTWARRTGTAAIMSDPCCLASQDGILYTMKRSTAQVFFSLTGNSWAEGPVLYTNAGDKGLTIIPMGSHQLLAILEGESDIVSSFLLDQDIIEYTSGRAATCSEEVYMTNHHLPWNLTHKLVYDDSRDIYFDVDQMVDVGALMCYDDFTRADGALGSTPVGGYAWGGTSGAVSSNAMVITPTFGAELLTNPGLEGVYVGGLAPGWGRIVGTEVLSEETVIIHGGTSSQKVVTSAVGGIDANPRASMVVDNWYQAVAWMYASELGAGALRLSIQGTAPGATKNCGLPGADAWYRLLIIYRAVATGTATHYFLSAVGGLQATFYCDDASVMALTASTIFVPCGPLPYQDVDARVNATLTAGTQAGLWIAGDAANPSNAVLAYHDGTKIYVDQIVAGVYTNKISSAQAYGAGTTIRIVKSGTTYTVYYGATNVGSTVIAGMTGYYTGTFSTYDGNSLDDWTVYRNG